MATMKFVSNGEVKEVDTDVMRLERLKKRLYSWAYAANRIAERQPTRMVGITLTYRVGVKWSPRHISEYMKKLRMMLDTNLLAYVWVAELQRRGAVHYHVGLLVKKGTDIPMPDESGQWKHGSSKIQTIKRVSATYLIKYIQKEDQKGGVEFPKGLRLFACVIRTEIPDEQRFWFRLTAIPGYVRATALSMWKKLLEVDPENPFAHWKWGAREGGGWWVQRLDLLELPTSNFKLLGMA